MTNSTPAMIEKKGIHPIQVCHLISDKWVRERVGAWAVGEMVAGLKAVVRGGHERQRLAGRGILLGTMALWFAGCATKATDVPPASDVPRPPPVTAVTLPVVAPATGRSTDGLMMQTSTAMTAAELAAESLVPLKERPDGGLIITHRVEVRGQVMRFSSLSRDAKKTVEFLAKNATGLADGQALLSAEQADEILAELTRVTGRDAMALPTVSTGAGMLARIGIGDPDFGLGGAGKWNEAEAARLVPGTFAPRTWMSALVGPNRLTSGRIQVDLEIEIKTFEGFVRSEPPAGAAVSAPTDLRVPVFSGFTRTASVKMARDEVAVFVVEPAETLEGRTASQDVRYLVFLRTKVEPVRR